MNRKSTLILLVVTLLVVGGAVLTRTGTGRAGATETLPAHVIPGLREKIDRIARIEITRAGESLALERRGETWGLADRAGYPANVDKVRDLAYGIAELRPIERKTDNPELHARIGVGEPSPDNPDTTLIVLRDAEGEELASLIVGGREFLGSRRAWYVRRPGEARAWLAEGSLETGTTLATWTDRDILRIPRERIESVTITHPDGEVLYIHREDEGARNFLVEGVPEGRSLTSEGVANPVGAALAFLSFEDVAGAEQAQIDFSRATIAEYVTWDGLVVTIRTVRRDDEYWIRISADAPGAAPEDEAEAGGAGGDGGEAEGEASGPAEEAAEISEKVAGRVFRVQEGKGRNFTKRLEDLLEPLPQADPAPDAEAAPGPPPPAPPPAAPGAGGGEG